MYEVFEKILSIEEHFSRYVTADSLSALQLKYGIKAYLDAVVAKLCEPCLISNCGWTRCKPRCRVSMKTSYAMKWSDESCRCTTAYETTIGIPFRRRRHTSSKPLFRDYELTVFQMTLRNGCVWCGFNLRVYEQYRNGTRIQVRNVELSDEFPHAIRFAVIDGDSLPDDVFLEDYPLAQLMVLFNSVLDRVVCERE